MIEHVPKKFRELPLYNTFLRYVFEGLPPGHFVKALLSNDLYTAVARADLRNQNCISEYVIFVENWIPSSCYGSEEAVEEWIQQGGLRDDLTLSPRIQVLKEDWDVKCR